MNTASIPSKVAPIKARHPKVSEPWDDDERDAKGNVPMGLAAAMPFLLVFIGVGALALWAVFSKG